jgi:hypothetical protein
MPEIRPGGCPFFGGLGRPFDSLKGKIEIGKNLISQENKERTVSNDDVPSRFCFRLEIAEHFA